MKKIFLVLLATLFVTSSAMSEVIKYKKQTVYVPAYSHIYVGSAVRPFDLAVTLSIRNTNSNEPITVSVADYYGTDGKLLKSFIKEPVVLKPFATIRYVIAESDGAGGSGANFLVKWNADKNVNAPVVESVMIGTRSSQGISFTSRGVVIED